MPPLSHNAIAKRECDFLEVMGQLDWIDKIEVIILAHLLLIKHRARVYRTYTAYFVAGLAAGGLVLIPVLIR